MVSDAEVIVVREIADGARVHSTATIGPFCTIGPEVFIGPGTVLARRVTVDGRTTIGADNIIGDGSAIGMAPQDLKFYGRETYLIIGDRNRFGPNVTAHIGTELGGYLTRIGDDNVLDASVHIAHDCYVDDRTHLEAGVLLAGHVRVETGAVIGELTGADAFTTIGRFSRVAPRTPLRRDVPAFSFFSSRGYYTAPGKVLGVNEEGLQRAGLTEAEKEDVRQAAQRLFGDDRALLTKLDQLTARKDLSRPVGELCASCRKSFHGRFGRRREVFRGKLPPEARQFLPADVLASIAEGAAQ